MTDQDARPPGHRIRVERLNRFRTQIGHQEFAARADLDRVDGRTDLRFGNTGRSWRFVTGAAPQGDPAGLGAAGLDDHERPSPRLARVAGEFVGV